MTPEDYRGLISTADIFKISLGQGGEYRKVAFENGCLVFLAGKNLLDAIMSGDEQAIETACAAIRTARYRNGNPPRAASSIWRSGVEEFHALRSNALVLHWQSEEKTLCWGITSEQNQIVKEGRNEFGQAFVIFHRPLLGGWKKKSLDGVVTLNNIHPMSISSVINQATFNRVHKNIDYFRSFILDDDLSKWILQPEWVKEARRRGWRQKDRASILEGQQTNSVVSPAFKTFEPTVVPPVQIDETNNIRVIEVIDYTKEEEYFVSEAKRMANTAVLTAEYANGQLAMTKIKNKDISFTLEELESEALRLLEEQDYCCALTGYDFKKKSNNIHLKVSLDRKDSSKGYVEGNLQVVTRGANFYKSASDADDWALKARALISMAIALKKRNSR